MPQKKKKKLNYAQADERNEVSKHLLVHFLNRYRPTAINMLGRLRWHEVVGLRPAELGHLMEDIKDWTGDCWQFRRHFYASDLLLLLRLRAHLLEGYNVVGGHPRREKMPDDQNALHFVFFPGDALFMGQLGPSDLAYNANGPAAAQAANAEAATAETGAGTGAAAPGAAAGGGAAAPEVAATAGAASPDVGAAVGT